MLYLESGCKPIRFLIMTRRLMFLHYILNEDDQSLVSRFFQAQNSQPYKDDWSAPVPRNTSHIGTNQEILKRAI